MKTITSTFVALLFIAQMLHADALKDNFTTGNPNITSINVMTFGPKGILFIGDSNTAQVVAIDVSDHPKADNSKVKIDAVDKIIADMLGAKIDEIQITDMVVNPENDNIYISAHHSSGTPVLFRVQDNTLKQVSLTDISHSKTKITDVVDKDAKDKRGRSLRKWAVADIKYHDGKVLLSGLSNKEFASTFRTIDFPFNDTQNYGSLEIYHAAHGQYETHAPIKTFLPTLIKGNSHIVAGYTCTPLVILPMDKIKPGANTKGRTVAELGNGNSPLDMIEIKNDNKRFLLISNSNRPLMKMDFDDLESFNEELTTPVTEKGAAAGVAYINLPYVNVLQLDKLGNSFVMLKRESNGNLALGKGSSWWFK